MTTNSHKHTHAPDHAHPHADAEPEDAERLRIQRLAWFLEAHFGEVEFHMPDADDANEVEQGEDAHEPALLVTLDEADAMINLLSMVCTRASFLQSDVNTDWGISQTVTSSSETLRRRVEAVLDMAVSTIGSLGEIFTAGVPLQMEEPQAADGLKAKSGSPSNLEPISEDVEETAEKDISMEEAPKESKEVPSTNGDDGGKTGADGEEEGDDEDDDADLQVHG